MFTIKNISFRTILNSHVKFTNEFIIEFDNGSFGVGASPQGETISIYEDRKISISPGAIIQIIEQDGLLGQVIDQVAFDSYLQAKIPVFGRNNAYGLSEAFFNAAARTVSIYALFDKVGLKAKVPRLALNILNGGWHAYTNPVLSDFSEFMLVAKSLNLHEVIIEHNEIQRLVRENQLRLEKTVVSGNPVNVYLRRDNEAVIEFILNIIAGLGLADKYDLMIDASAGDLWKEQAYHFEITTRKSYTSEQMLDYWLSLIHQYNLRFLEDPFHERDFSAWQSLTSAQNDCLIIGDNLYSSDELRILEGAEKKYATAAVIKPNQAGTVTAVCRSLEAALRTGQIAITSHRSISTESTFLSLLTCLFGAQYIKIGPLMTDYSSIIRLNEIIRITEEK